MRFIDKRFSHAAAGMMLKAGGGMILIPLAVRKLNSDELGLAYLFINISQLIFLLDLGISSAIIRFAAYSHAGADCFKAQGRPEGECKMEPNWLLTSQLSDAVHRIYTIMAIIGALALSLCGLIVWREIKRAGLPPNLLGAWAICIPGIVLGFWCSGISSVMSGCGFIVESMRALWVSQLFGIACNILLLFSGAGAWAYAFGMLTAGVVQLAIVLHDYSKITEIKKGINGSPQIPALWGSAWRQGVVAIGGFFIRRTGSLIAPGLIGLSASAKLGLALQCIGFTAALAFAYVSVIIPEMSRLRAIGDPRPLAKLFGRRVYSAVLIYLAATVPLILFGNQLLQIFGAKTTFPELPVFCLIAVTVLLEAHHGQYAILVTTENLNPFVIPAIVSGISSVGAAFFLGTHFGLFGIVAGPFLVQLVWNNWWTVKRGIEGMGLSWKDYWREIKN